MSLGLIVNHTGEIAQAQVGSEFGQFAIPLNDFEIITGWKLKPEGLCIDQICVAVRDPKSLTNQTEIDIVEFARITNQNIVVDHVRKIAALGEHADTRSEAMTTLDAPDFTLPDIHGKQVSFSDFNRRKRLLLAWSSW
jgi:hypothetical protein